MHRNARVLIRYLVGTKAHPTKGPDALVDNVLGADTSVNLPTSQQYLTQLPPPTQSMVIDGTSTRRGLTDKHQHTVMRIGGAQILSPTQHSYLPNMDKTNPVYYAKTSPRDAGLCGSLTAQLRRLKIYRLTELQGALIPLLLKGQHVIAHAETGTGKSFGIALSVANRIQRESVSYRLHTIIFTPTEELALQYDRWLKHFGGCASQVCQPAIPSIPLQIQLAKLHNIQPHVLVGTPQRIADITLAAPHLFGEKLRRKVDSLILDEADLILDCEVSFKDTTLKGSDLIDRLYRSHANEVPAQIVAASATIDGATAQKINGWMRNDSVVRISTSFVEHTIPEAITFYFMSGNQRSRSLPDGKAIIENEGILMKMLSLILKHHSDPRILVFTSYDVNDVCEVINRSATAILKKARDPSGHAKFLGEGAHAFAGSLATKPIESESQDRQVRYRQIVAKDKSVYVRDDENVSKLCDGRLCVGVGGYAISRGLHVTGATHVIVFGDAPPASEFVHCAGRTGRMRQEGEVITIFPPSSGKAIQDICRSLELPFKLTRESAVDALLEMEDYFEAETAAEQAAEQRRRVALRERAKELDEEVEDAERLRNEQRRKFEQIFEQQQDEVTTSMDPHLRAQHLDAILFPE